ncbi:MAG: CPBP family intramembrane metalloprotease, partial [Bacteroidetes bacterium]|nr:CPBP family intramembrane metalloprotease [Bacteroidota bacterium]
QTWQTVGKIILFGLGFLALTRLVSEIAWLFARPVYQSLLSFDPDGSFLPISLHHIWQGLFAFLVILLLGRIFRFSLTEFGFNLNEWRYSVRLMLHFSLFWFFVQGIMGYMMVSSGGQSAFLAFFNFPLTTWNLGGFFVFQILLSGTSEEILFRALVMTPLIVYGKRAGLADKPTALLAAGIATLIFMLAHINIAFDPLRITNFNLLQQLASLGFGIFYAFLFLRTRSILGPILAHNLLNTIIGGIGLLLFIIFG